MTDISLAAVLAPDMAELVAAACVKCWEEDHRPPPASAIYLMDDYEWEVICQRRHEGETSRLAWDDGWRGGLNDLQIAAHREMYARSGDDADLARMLRHVT